VRGPARADLVGDVVAQLAQAVGHADLGLGDEVHRAELQRRSVTSAPRSVSVETITTGIGRSRIRLGEEVDAVHARHLDVQRDDVRVEVADHLARHQRVAGRADALHVGWRLMISASRLRTSAESSTTTTRSCPCSPWFLRSSCRSEQVDRAAAAGDRGRHGCFARRGALLRQQRRRYWSVPGA
jgi:hypothetical protein